MKDIPGPGAHARSAGDTGPHKPRSDNERLILSLIRRHEALPKADLARLTGLSPTAAGSIIRQLEKDGLVLRGAPLQGRVGQPSVPYSLNPGGAYAFGLKIGRRSCEIALLDATMRQVAAAGAVHDYPMPDAVLDFTIETTGRMLAELPPTDQNRICGLGVAMPSHIWDWSREMRVPAGALDIWRDLDLVTTWSAGIGMPVHAGNDATAACAAELAVGTATDAHDVLHIFVGWFIGGGIVLEGRVRAGRRGNAGALGSMPICGNGAAPEQLIQSASLYGLEAEIDAGGGDVRRLWIAEQDWSWIGAPLDRWIDKASRGVAQAIASAASVFDFEAVVIDGSFPADVRNRFVNRVRERYETQDRQGLSPLAIHEGTVGRNARAIGAACLPLLAAFAVDETVLGARAD